MAITYSAQAGTTITTALVGVASLATQTGGTNQVQIPATGGSTAPSTADNYNNNVGTGVNGLGDTYVGRLCILRKGTATQEIRIINSASYATNVVTLTVNEDWSTAPTSGDAFDVAYEPGDIEDGGAGGGINLNSKTGLYELSNNLTVANTGVLQIANGNALELDDGGNSPTFIIQSGGWYLAGLSSSGADISGGIMPSYNNTTGEPSTQIQSGGNAYIFDTTIWAQLVAQQFECADGSNGNFNRVKWLRMSDELHLFDATVNDCSVGGRGSTTDIVRVDAGTTCNGFVVSNVQTMDSAANTTTETIELEGVLFTNVATFISIRNNKTWNMLDPIWSVTDHTDFDETNVTGTAAINDRRTIKATVQKADGTKINNALVNIYTHQQSVDGGGATAVEDLTLKTTSDTNGSATGSFIYTAHNWTGGAGTTTVYSGHALQAGAWLYNGFVASQASDSAFSGAVILTVDENISETTQATAKSAGTTAGVTWNEDTNPSSIIEFTGGTGTLSVGDTVTGGTSTADGIVTEILSGDSTAGTVHLRSRDANAFTGTESLSNGTGWTATLTASSEKRFSIWIDAKNISLQALYDYLSAIQTETTLTATGELIWEWCRDQNTKALYSDGTNFYTERYDGPTTAEDKGIIVVNKASGNVNFYTSDDGSTWAPPTTYTFRLTGLYDGTEVRIYRTSDDAELAGVEDVTGGIGTDATPGVTISGSTDNNTFTYSYQYGGSSVGIYYVLVNLQYIIVKQKGLELANQNQSIPTNLFFDRNYYNP